MQTDEQYDAFAPRDAVATIHRGELGKDGKAKRGPRKQASSTVDRTISLSPSQWAYLKLFVEEGETTPGKPDILTGEGDAFNASQALVRALGELRAVRPFGAKGGRKRAGNGRFCTESGAQQKREAERPQLEARIRQLEKQLAAKEGK